MGTKPKQRRTYSDKITTKRGFTNEYLRRGLKTVHIGDNVWTIGKPKHINVSNKKDNHVTKLHQVITGPDNKEYHIYDDTIDKLNYDQNTFLPFGTSKYGNHTDHAKLKVYILTNILDKVENWCFDISKKIPPKGPLKVIYENGTVKNIEFNGTWEKAIIGKYGHVVAPVGYRKAEQKIEKLIVNMKYNTLTNLHNKEELTESEISDICVLKDYFKNIYDNRDILINKHKYLTETMLLNIHSLVLDVDLKLIANTYKIKDIY